MSCTDTLKAKEKQADCSMNTELSACFLNFF
nr:MAG TPA: hypothetical protein [Caudoviricetes sp.]